MCFFCVGLGADLRLWPRRKYHGTCERCGALPAVLLARAPQGVRTPGSDQALHSYIGEYSRNVMGDHSGEYVHDDTDDQSGEPTFGAICDDTVSPAAGARGSSAAQVADAAAAAALASAAFATAWAGSGQ